MPFLALAITLVSPTGAELIGSGKLLLFTFRQLILGILVGLARGYPGARYLYRGRQSGWISGHF
jgi:hypothetical protein